MDFITGVSARDANASQNILIKSTNVRLTLSNTKKYCVIDVSKSFWIDGSIVRSEDAIYLQMLATQEGEVTTHLRSSAAIGEYLILRLKLREGIFLIPPCC